MEPKPQLGAIGCVPAVTNLDSAETLVEEPSLCKSISLRGLAGRKRGLVWSVLPPFILH